MAKYLLLFAIVFFLYQRFLNLGMLRAASYNSTVMFRTNLVTWGFVLSTLAGIGCWWLLRLDWFRMHVGLMMIGIVFVNAFFVYLVGLWSLGFFSSQDSEVDTFEEVEGDPGYEHVKDMCCYSWWTSNPIFVLKCKYMQSESAPGYEIDGDCGRGSARSTYWPQNSAFQGFIEVGMGYRQVPNTLQLTFDVEGGGLTQASAIARKISDVHANYHLANKGRRCMGKEVFMTAKEKAHLASMGEKARGLVLSKHLAHLQGIHAGHVLVSVSSDGKVRALIAPPPPPRADTASWVYFVFTMADVYQSLCTELGTREIYFEIGKHRQKEWIYSGGRHRQSSGFVSAET